MKSGFESMIKAPVITGSAFRLILSGLLLSLFFSFSESGAAGQKADYLIIEKPSALHILNQFQMRIEKNNIILNSQFVPFRIVEEDIILSDKITSAHKVEFDHKPYYLILDEKDRLLGQDLCGLVIKETNCVTLGDSIKTLSDRIRALPDPRTSTSVSLPGQNTYYRIYQKGRRFALLQEGKPLKFFWSRLTPVSEWEIIRPVTARKSISSSGIEKKIKEKFDTVNDIYREFTEAFNARFNKNLDTPLWQVEITETAVTAVLAGIGPDSLLESRKALINELEYVILGTEYSIYEEENVILIKKPNGY